MLVGGNNPIAVKNSNSPDLDYVLIESPGMDEYLNAVNHSDGSVGEKSDGSIIANILDESESQNSTKDDTSASGSAEDEVSRELLENGSNNKNGHSNGGEESF